MMRGIPVTNGQYAGDAFSWLHPFAILTGIGLVLGYALLGANWLVLKSEGDLHDWALHRIRWLAAGVLAVLFLAFALTFDYSVLARNNLSITVANAAAPDTSLRFLLYAGVVVLPIIAIYTIGVYWVIRGKLREGYRAERQPDHIG
jgi:cytochrome bd-type quinol oxidase subunit 2